MNPLRIALWTIERKLGETLVLDDVAEASGLSRRHLARAFALQTGLSVMAYARARRLSEAAKALRDSEITILAAALGLGYGSHEAFARAFADYFGVSPSEARRAEIFNTLTLQEAVTMSVEPSSRLAAPKIIKGAARRIAGIRAHYPCGSYAGIPAQWGRLREHMGSISGERRGAAYGVCFNFNDDGDMDYLAGVEIAPSARAEGGLETVDLAAGDYAVFTHDGHVSGIGSAWRAIYTQGLPALGRQPTNAPQFEYMDARFEPATGSGFVEIWIPLLTEE